MPFHDGEFGLLYMSRDRFDFNLHFEQLFFSILPCTLFIVCSLWRAITLSRKPLVVHAPIFQLIKLVCRQNIGTLMLITNFDLGSYHNLCWSSDRAADSSRLGLVPCHSSLHRIFGSQPRSSFGHGDDQLY